MSKHKHKEAAADYYSSLYAAIILTTIKWLFENEDPSVDEIIGDLKKVFDQILV